MKKNAEKVRETLNALKENPPNRFGMQTWLFNHAAKDIIHQNWS
jgi:hypothetical protein